MIIRMISWTDIVLDRTVVTYILISSHATLQSAVFHSHMQQLFSEDAHELSTSDNIYCPWHQGENILL